MAEFNLSKLLLGATSLFISGLIVFYVVHFGMTLWENIETSLMNRTVTPETQSVLSLLRIVPTILTIMYILVVVAVIYYLIYTSTKEKKKPLPSPYEETIYGPKYTAPYTTGYQ